jgi:hypothetical protein
MTMHATIAMTGVSRPPAQRQPQIPETYGQQLRQIAECLPVDGFAGDRAISCPNFHVNKLHADITCSAQTGWKVVLITSAQRGVGVASADMAVRIDVWLL